MDHDTIRGLAFGGLCVIATIYIQQIIRALKDIANAIRERKE